MKKFLAWIIVTLVSLAIIGLWIYGNYCLYIWTDQGSKATTNQMMLGGLTMLADIGVFLNVIRWSLDTLSKEEEIEKLPDNLLSLEHNPFDRK